MKSNKKVKVVILILFLTEIISLFLTYKSFLNKEINKIKETYEVKNKTFSLFIEKDNGYEEYTKSNKFPDGYQINLDKSKCVDTKGNVIEGILSGIGNGITVRSNKTAYCYLYFDIETAVDYLVSNVSNDVLWESTLEDDGYRYVGTNPDNYICFGTTDKSTCIGDTDKYMYRIIGIFEDETGTQHLKLIKKISIGEYAWNSDVSVDIDWDESELHNGLNGSYFSSNTDYSYMQDANWYSKITTWNYTETNTKTYESSGPNYYNSVTVQNIYLHEMNRNTKTSLIGTWDAAKTKIGLMYVNDYLLSLGSSALGYKTYDNRTTLKNGWMHISNNDSGEEVVAEWTMSHYGADSSGRLCAWRMYMGGYVSAPPVNGTISVRPVFYLTSDVAITGEGTSTNPYIIS